MKTFLDTAEVDEIKTAARWGVIDGATDTGVVQFKKDWEAARRRAGKDG